MNDHWSTAYVGIPFEDRGRGWAGCDCWGLVRLVFWDQFKIDLPTYTGSYLHTDEQAQIDTLLSQAKLSPTWEEVTKPEEYDVAMFRRGHLQTHVGVMVDERNVLHMDGEDRAKIARVDYGPLRFRLVGYFRNVNR
ncbi:MAG: NlpC/P60 family protein [Pseudomonadota bacterium]